MSGKPINALFTCPPVSDRPSTLDWPKNPWGLKGKEMMRGEDEARSEQTHRLGLIPCSNQGPFRPCTLPPPEHYDVHHGWHAGEEALKGVSIWGLHVQGGGEE